VLIAILGGILLLLAVFAALAGWRRNKLQSSDTFAPTDHVDIVRGPGLGGRGYLDHEVHHDDDEPGFQLGD
jgi:hypothetical protein